MGREWAALRLAHWNAEMQTMRCCVLRRCCLWELAACCWSGILKHSSDRTPQTPWPTLTAARRRAAAAAAASAWAPSKQMQVGRRAHCEGLGLGPPGGGGTRGARRAWRRRSLPCTSTTLQLSAYCIYLVSRSLIHTLCPTPAFLVQPRCGTARWQRPTRRGMTRSRRWPIQQRQPWMPASLRCPKSCAGARLGLRRIAPGYGCIAAWQPTPCCLPASWGMNAAAAPCQQSIVHTAQQHAATSSCRVLPAASLQRRGGGEPRDVGGQGAGGAVLPDGRGALRGAGSRIVLVLRGSRRSRAAVHVLQGETSALLPWARNTEPTAVAIRCANEIPTC